MDQLNLLPYVPLILSTFGFLAGNVALVLVLSRYFSTHRIEYVTKQEQEKLRETFAPSYSPTVPLGPNFPGMVGPYTGPTGTAGAPLTPQVSTEALDELFGTYLDFNTMPTSKDI